MTNKRCTDCMIDIENKAEECDECGDHPLCEKCHQDHLFFHDSGFEMLK